MIPTAGEKAPAFALKNSDGKTVKLSDFKGEKVVLYFYPRDLTPGCTKEACGFQTDLPQFKKEGVTILGVSTDGQESHKKFAEKYNLTFPLLCDENHEVAERYGVWQEKNMYGKKSWGVARTTFIIDEDGKIAQVFKKVSPEEHSKEVLDILEKL